MYCHKVLRVLLLKRKKKGPSRSVFWLHILACILCCLSALINIHAHVYKTSNCVANSCLGKFSFSNCLKLKAPCGRTGPRFGSVGPCSSVTCMCQNCVTSISVHLQNIVSLRSVSKSTVSTFLCNGGRQTQFDLSSRNCSFSLSQKDLRGLD